MRLLPGGSNDAARPGGWLAAVIAHEPDQPSRLGGLPGSPQVAPWGHTTGAAGSASARPSPVVGAMLGSRDSTKEFGEGGLRRRAGTLGSTPSAQRPPPNMSGVSGGSGGGGARMPGMAPKRELPNPQQLPGGDEWWVQLIWPGFVLVSTIAVFFGLFQDHGAMSDPAVLQAANLAGAGVVRDAVGGAGWSQQQQQDGGGGGDGALLQSTLEELRVQSQMQTQVLNAQISALESLNRQVLAQSAALTRTTEKIDVAHMELHSHAQQINALTDAFQRQVRAHARPPRTRALPPSRSLTYAGGALVASPC
eukprot:COSAG05_NODE_385_length_10486_cov_12.944835_2_plen_308_part_00